METFDTEWLALREPADRRARDRTLPERLRAAWRRRGWSRVVDLGSGTGANLRYLAPRLPSGQRWTLVDHDPRHVDRLRRLEAPPEVDAVAAVSRDLAADGLAVVDDADLVTASALLDLVSESWLAELVNRCVDAACGAYFALTCDGRMRWMTESAAGWRGDDDPDDGFVWSVFNRHQRIDKGFGPALGPTAAVSAARLFQEAGYRTWLASSAWRLDAGDRRLVDQLVEGWAAAAAELRPEHAARVEAWASRRWDALSHGSFRVTVGHRDLLALPGDAE